MRVLSILILTFCGLGFRCEGADESVMPTAARPRLAFGQGIDLSVWQDELRRLLAVEEPPGGKIAWSAKRVYETDEYTMDHIAFTSEPGQRASAYLLRPKAVEPPYRVMICLQGHSPGMHVSIGRKDPHRLDRVSPMEGDRDFALQAVRHGWAALAVEHRGFGERAVKGVSCGDLALRSFLEGRPLLGRRVWDVVRAIDFIGVHPDLDGRRIGCMGNSGGGTVSFFAGCVDRRIRLVVDSCSFCTYADSWLAARHCPCGYLPGILTVADMPDLAGLIAPRGLILVAGRDDPLAKLSGVQAGYETAQSIYRAAGSPGRVKLVIGKGGHRFYAGETWPVIEKMAAEWEHEDKTGSYGTPGWSRCPGG